MVTTTDAEIPTISTGLPNVATGHCAKTLAILQLSLKDIDELRHIRWLMLVDDDTLLRCVCVCAGERRVSCDFYAAYTPRSAFNLNYHCFFCLLSLYTVYISPLIPTACPD